MSFLQLEVKLTILYKTSLQSKPHTSPHLFPIQLSMNLITTIITKPTVLRLYKLTTFLLV